MTIARIAKCTFILSILSAVGSCSSPAGLVPTRPTAINEAPVDPALAAEMEAFMVDHQSGWKKSPSIVKLTPALNDPRFAPEDYVLIQDAAGRRFSYGYQFSTLIRKRGIGGNYYYKDVPPSEVERLKGLLQRAPGSSTSAYAVHTPTPPQRSAPAAVAVAPPVAAANPAAVAAVPTPPAPRSATVAIATNPRSIAVSEGKLAFLKSIWPKHSTLSPTSVGLDKPGYVYTGSVDEATIKANEAKYEARFGETLYLRKFGW